MDSNDTVSGLEKLMKEASQLVDSPTEAETDKGNDDKEVAMQEAYVKAVTKFMKMKAIQLDMPTHTVLKCNAILTAMILADATRPQGFEAVKKAHTSTFNRAYVSFTNDKKS